MNILWSSNAMWAQTGYGVQAKHLLPRLRALGHNVAQFAWFGLQGACIEASGIRVYPQLHDPWGNDIVQGHVKHHKADLVISLQDIWVLPETYAEMIHDAGALWCCWFPVDHDPIPDQVLERARTADYPINYSKHGQRAAAQAELHCPYIPHGVSDQYLHEQISRQDARDKLEWSQNAIIFSMVAANKSMPSRKSFPAVMLAFKRILDAHPNALLYVHTDNRNPAGVNFERLMDRCEVPASAVRFPNQYLNAIGSFGEDYMATVYRASDCLLSPSMSEGFGIPILEAQACGTPVITSQFTSMTELTCFGIAVPPISYEWTPMNSWVCVPGPERIADAMETVIGWSDEYKTTRSAEARAWAAQYSWDSLVTDFWEPFLARVERDLERAQPCDHKWAGTGLFDEQGVMSVPCLKCGASLQPESKTITLGAYKHEIGGIALDLEDDPESGVSFIVCKEADRDYRLQDIPFEAGDLVIEVGAHVGEISIYVAKAHPEINVIALEPDPVNFAHLQRNAQANDVEITARPWAVGPVAGIVEIHRDAHNSGGSTLRGNGDGIKVRAVHLRDVIADRPVKLLVMDCEGAEYSILTSDIDLLDQVEWLVGEFHAGEHGHDIPTDAPNALLRLVHKHIPPERVRVKTGLMRTA